MSNTRGMLAGRARGFRRSLLARADPLQEAVDAQRDDGGRGEAQPEYPEHTAGRREVAV